MTRKELRIIIQEIEDKLELFLFNLKQKSLTEQEFNDLSKTLCESIQLLLKQNQVQWRYNIRSDPLS